jgi:hypothetical protein
MTQHLRRLRRFRFNLPQRIAAGLLALFLLQEAFLAGHLPLLWQRLPFLAGGCLLGGGLWWVTRRLYGNLGGYTALVLYCFSPAVLKACAAPDAGIYAALGVYGGVYTCIGVAHAMQGPRGKWRPRIVLLTVLFAMAAGAQMLALAATALLGLGLMLWVAEGRRSLVPPVVLESAVAALALLFVYQGFSPAAFRALFLSASLPRLSLAPAWEFFFALPHAGVALAAAAALLLYLSQRRTRYFGNTAPLLCALVLFSLVTKAASGLWALPFLLTFIGGVFADAYESRRGRLALGVAVVLVLLQVALCLRDLPGLL